MNGEIAIVSAARTAIGKFGGTLAKLSAADLGAVVIKEALHRAQVAPGEIDDVVMGQILTGGAGQNPARQAAMAAGVPQECPAITINHVCGSGLRAVHLAAVTIAAGEAQIVVAGGQENMSAAPYVLPGARDGFRLGDAKLLDAMVLDGLTDAFHHYHMGITAENVAEKCKVSREDQDAFAAASQNKAEAAQKAGRFADEITAVTIPQRKGDDIVFDADEYPRHGATAESLGKLRPAFRKDGTVTAGNASGINDGAAALVLMTAAAAQKRGLTPLALIKAGAFCGVDPAVMGLGPIPAAQKCLSKAGWNVGDLDLAEINEAFAAQALAVNRELGFDADKVNVNGGAIALGHPIGASGARILTTLLYEMRRRESKRGLAGLCIGGGMGIALAVERP
jgi:acetyl-CoA C-acetyltransferase